jgi:hypothetical protein
MNTGTYVLSLHVDYNYISPSRRVGTTQLVYWQGHEMKGQRPFVLRSSRKGNECPDCLWGTTAWYLMRSRRCFFENVCLGCKVDQTPPSSPKAKNKWSYSSTCHIPSWHAQGLHQLPFIFFHSIKLDNCIICAYVFTHIHSSFLLFQIVYVWDMDTVACC